MLWLLPEAIAEEQGALQCGLRPERLLDRTRVGG